MNEQKFYPELVEFSHIEKTDLRLNNINFVIENVFENVMFKIDVDMWRYIGRGSFGTVYSCDLYLFDGKSYKKQDTNLAFKMLKNLKCQSNSEIMNEILIQCLLSKTSEKTIPIIYRYLFYIKDLSKCYNGILFEKIENGDILTFRNYICNPSHNKPIPKLVDIYFSAVSQIKETLSSFYDLYKFKHNDLHQGNVLFSDTTPKIIDFGESTIFHTFDSQDDEDEKQVVKIVPTIDQITTLYSIPKLKEGQYNEFEGLIDEIISLYGKYPLSDLHLYVFSCYGVFENTSTGFNRKLGLVEIGDEFFHRFSTIYKFDRLKLYNKSIYFTSNNNKNIKIEIDDSYKNIYKKVFQILNYYENSGDIKRTRRSFYDFLFKAWKIENFRYLAYFTEIYMNRYNDYKYFDGNNITPISLIKLPYTPQINPNPVLLYDEIDVNDVNDNSYKSFESNVSTKPLGE